MKNVLSPAILHSQSKPGQSPGGLLFFNGNILTLDNRFSPDDNLAVHIRGEKIISVKPFLSYSRKIIAGTRLIDLKGQYLMPGLIESHGHLFGAALSKIGAIMPGGKTKEETLQWLSAEARRQNRKKWVIAAGWDQSDWSRQEFPDSAEIDAIIPDKPVFFSRVGGHTAWLNSKALKAAGITDKTRDPDGGIICRDSSGRATGILIDNAMFDVARKAYLKYGMNPFRILNMAEKAAFENGITTFNELALPSLALPLVKIVYALKRMSINLRIHISADNNTIRYMKKNKPGHYSDNRLEISSIKMFIDGAMGSFGALLSEPYSDNHLSHGIQTLSDPEMLALAAAAKAEGYQLAAHAIGDLASSKVLDAYTRVIGRDEKGEYRWKLEHAQFLQPCDIERLGKNKYIASVQPLMATSDMKWIHSRLGAERGKTTYPWRSMIDRGAFVTGGSDVPIESMNPFKGMYAAVTRQDDRGYPPEGFNPDERVSRDEAVKMYTTWAAYASFREDRIGMIREGYDADLVILDRDITTVPPRELLETKVLATWLRGKPVYESDR